MKKIYLIGILVVACLVALPLGAFAIPITGEGSDGSSFKGSLTYNVYDLSATLQVTLAVSSPTNTYLGGFAFTNESILKASMETTGNFVLSGYNGSFQVRLGNIAQNTLGDIALDTLQQVSRCPISHHDVRTDPAPGQYLQVDSRFLPNSSAANQVEYSARS